MKSIMKKDGIKLSRKCLENDLWCLQEAIRLNLSETTIRKLADIAKIQKMMFDRAMQRHQR